MEMNRQTSSSQKKFQTDIDADFITKEIAGILADPALCKTIFETLTPSGSGPSNINGKYSSSSTTGFGTSNIKITSYQFSNSTSFSEITDSTKETALIINFATPKIVSTSVNVIKPRRIKLIFTTDPDGTFKTCVSGWVNQQDYWTKRNGSNDIYYNTGNVGIGSTAPTTLLYVKKGLNPDSANQPVGNFITTIYNATNSTEENGLLIKNNWGNTESTPLEVGRDNVGGSYKSFFKINGAGQVGIGTSNPTKILAFDGTAARTVWMERNTSATNGMDFTIQAGGATSASANQNGGDLNISSGIATGTGSSNIYF